MFVWCILGVCNFDYIPLFLMIQDFKMTGREFLELDSPQRRLYLERVKRVEIIHKLLNELPKSDQ